MENATKEYLKTLESKIAASAGQVVSYNSLSDKPQIEGITLSGNKTYEELNLQRLTNSDIENMLT